MSDDEGWIYLPPEERQRLQEECNRLWSRLGSIIVTKSVSREEFEKMYPPKEDDEPIT